MYRFVALPAVLVLVALVVARTPSAAMPTAGQPVATTRALLGLPTAQVDRTPTLDRVPPGVEIGPFPVADGIEVVYYYFHSGRSNDDPPYVFGELRNTTDVPYQAPSLRFVLLDDEGNIAGTVSAQPLYERIEGGQVLPFSGPFFPSEAPGSLDDFSSAEIEACYGGFAIDPTEDDASELELREDGTEREGNEIQVQGKIFNGAEVDAERVAVKAAFFDGDGRYVGDISDYLRVSIPAGRTAPFSIDHGYDTFHSFNPIDYAGNGEDAVYDLSIGFDSGVRVGCG